MSVFPTNQARGDVAFQLGDQAIILRLTLGALAELETLFDAHSFEALEAALRAMSARQMLMVLCILSAGGGQRVLPEALATHPIDPAKAASAIALCFAQAGT